MRKIASVVLVFFVLSISGFAQSLSFVGEKTESDTIVNSLRNAAKDVTSLKGVNKKKTLAVLIVEDSGKEGIGFGGHGSNTIQKLFQNIPVIGWFISVNTTLWSAARMAQPTASGEYGNMYSRSSIAEAFIISELINKGYNVVEASLPFYGDVEKIFTNNEAAKQDGVEESKEAVRNYGRQLGADTVIIGSVGGSIYKVIEEENYFSLNRNFISDFKMNLRTIDTRSSQVLDADTFSGVDSVKTLESVKWLNIVVTGALIGVATAAIVTDGFSSDDEYYDEYDDSYSY
jgi:hypothetical protein